MKLIVGLGNPGQKYEHTHHNAGFLAIDVLTAAYNVPTAKTAHSALVSSTTINGEKVIFAKPQTYMNLSGHSVGALVHYYKVPLENLLIIYDDKDFPVGTHHFRYQGSGGGHNGIKSVIEQLKSSEFPRLRLGIGNPPTPTQTLVDWVLTPFTTADLATLTTNLQSLVGFIED